jgi:hypothetical protein
VCRDCGKDKHENDCKDPKYCVNCEGQHSASSRECPKWKTEQEIQKVKTLEKLSFAEAKKKVMATQSNTLPQSFASVAASSKPAEAPINTQLEPLIVAITKLTERLVNLETIVLSLRKPSVPVKQAQCSRGAPSSQQPSQSQTQPNKTSAAAKVAAPQGAASKAAAPQSPSGANPRAPSNSKGADGSVKVGDIRVPASAVSSILTNIPRNSNRYEILQDVDVDMTINAD